MARYRLTRRAENDLSGIADYTIRQFGIGQARRYRDGLIKAFGMLVEHPRLGSDQGNIRSGVRRLIYESHAIYYRPAGNEIVILRILGPRQDPLRHL